MKKTIILFLSIFFCTSGYSQTEKDYSDSAQKKFYQGGDINGALAILNEGLIKYPDAISLLFNRANVLQKLERRSEAIADLTLGINNYLWEISTPYTEEQKKYLAEAGYYSRGIAKGKLKDYEGAILDYNQAIYLNDKHVNAYFNRAMMKINLNQQGSACYDFSIAESLGDKEANYYIRLYCGK